jgi:hypothetical protein
VTPAAFEVRVLRALLRVPIQHDQRMALIELLRKEGVLS